MSKKVHIYGAGMSGLIAAINLAREDFDVIVYDREKSYGGSSLYNPSTHVTPLDVERTKEYIGIDISPAFHPLTACPSYFHETKVMLPVGGVYAVERGSRKESLDTLLMEECKKYENISFEWESPLRKENLSKLPENTIIACGLNPVAYELLEIPYLRWYGWISRGEIEFGTYAWLWWDECISEYGYFSSVNNYYFNLLFSTREVTKSCLEKYSKFILRNEGIEHKEWHYVSGAVPLASPKNPKLFWNGAILCGTISGAMDPMLWFGISGALVTGKVAAMAVSDPERALTEFKRFTRRFRENYYVKKLIWSKFIRPNVKMLETAVKIVGPKRIEKLGKKLEDGKLPMRSAIPGFSHISCS